MDQNLIAVIVGIVEGLTEFLPVSSTGHMIIVGNLIGFTGDLADLFDVFVQLGAILSIVFIYKERFLRFFTKEGWQVGRGLSAWHIAVGIVPAMLAGFFFYKYIKLYLFSPLTVAIGLILGALLLLYAEKTKGSINESLLQDIDKLTLKQALHIGLFQILSLWPGFSRSGSTLAGGMLVGVSRDVAAQYTFLMAVPLMLVACVYDLLKNLKALANGGDIVLAIGFMVAFATAYGSVLWFLRFLKSSTLSAFAYYRIALAGLVLLYFGL